MNNAEIFLGQRAFGGTRGRRAFKSADELDSAIFAYFRHCDMSLEPSRLKRNSAHKAPPPTICGLCAWLGISRQTLLNYRKRKEFGHVIARARRVIAYKTEQRLFDSEGYKAARFSLAVNFGWTTQSRVELSGSDREPINFDEIDELKRANMPSVEPDEACE